MTLIAFLPLLVCLVGLGIYAVASNLEEPTRPALAEVGRIAYAMGLLATLLLGGAVFESCSASTTSSPPLLLHEHR